MRCSSVQRARTDIRLVPLDNLKILRPLATFLKSTPPRQKNVKHFAKITTERERNRQSYACGNPSLIFLLTAHEKARRLSIGHLSLYTDSLASYSVSRSARRKPMSSILRSILRLFLQVSLVSIPTRAYNENVKHEFCSCCPSLPFLAHAGMVTSPTTIPFAIIICALVRKAPGICLLYPRKKRQEN